MRQASQDQAEQEPDLETTYGAEAAALIRDIISLSTVHGPLKIVFKDLGSDTDTHAPIALRDQDDNEVATGNTSVATVARVQAWQGDKKKPDEIQKLELTLERTLRHQRAQARASPSRRSSAPTSPGAVPVHASAARTIRRLYAGENWRRLATATTSGSGATVAGAGSSSLALRAPSEPPACEPFSFAKSVVLVSMVHLPSTINSTRKMSHVRLTQGAEGPEWGRLQHQPQENAR